MQATTPHYLLYSDSQDDRGAGRWRFVLRSADGADRLEAEELETNILGERLELLAVVRGLEALDQPSRVTLVTTSSYVREGIRHGVLDWRKNGWCWEFYGQMVPIKHQDLWKRVDRAMAFHDVECRTVRVDPPRVQQSSVQRASQAVPPPHMPCPAPSAGLFQERRIASKQAPLRHPSRKLSACWQQCKQWFTTVWMTLAPSVRVG